MVFSQIIKQGYYTYIGVSMSVLSRYPFGTNVFERDWDVLVLLDTCRVDALKEVSEEYVFLDESKIESMWSQGSGSAEWIANTFRQKYIDEIQHTAYVSANGFAQRVLNDREFPDDDRGLSWSNWSTVTGSELKLLDQPWYYTSNHPEWHTKPRPVTDRAIDIQRSRNPNRLILHYSQPHHPYAANARKEGRDTLKEYEAEPFKYLREGGSHEKVWSEYLDQLREVLDDVGLLLENIDANKVAISADHGEAFGELGFLYGHPYAILHPAIRKVPWVTTTATNKKTYEPTLEYEPVSSDVGKKTKEQLEKLGYRG